MTYHIYITKKDIVENHPKYFHHNHYIADRFLMEHGVKVVDLSKFRYHQNKNNQTGELVMEVEIDSKWVDPVVDKILHGKK